jgi:hypothetical protein
MNIKSVNIIFSQEINYDSARGGVSVITEKGDTTTSYLLIQRARQSDNGKYTCAPSNSHPKSVTVHILNGLYYMPKLKKFIIHDRTKFSCICAFSTVLSF